MGRINFEDHALIRRRWVDKKMNVTSGMFKKKKKWGNYQEQFVFVARSCVHFLSFGIHSNMNAKSAIEKLQQITKEKEA